MGNEAITLAEFTARVGNSIHSRPELRNVWITAELSDVAVRGGHFYSDLIQKNDAGQTVARMRANLWAGQYQVVRRKFLAERQDELRNGIKVKLQGSATHHNLYGISFNITDIDPSYVDEGDILRRRMEILQQMKDEGIFDANRQVPLAEDAQRVAVISAEGAAGLGDFINQLQNNPDRFRFTVGFFPSPMQGDKVPAGIISALQAVYAEQQNWDCVVIIRGGGATSDMNSFDNAQLARNVCYFPLPVIVGIGHERDNCVLDYIAHTRCKTPTAVAEFLIDHQRRAWQKVADKVGEIIRYTNLYLDGERQRIAQLETAIPATALQLMQREELRLKNFSTSIPLAAGTILTRENTRLEALGNQIAPSLSNLFSRVREKLEAAERLLAVLSPANTLKRGYSITRIGGKALRSVDGLPEGAILETELSSGKIISEVTSKSE